ncbi:MAG: AMP-binding protein, partial [Clostridia bacterium]|nr:AMP-binding protein [Clostridia bacterium]
MELNKMSNELKEVAFRIKEMREIAGYTVEEMAEKVDISTEQYVSYEQGAADFPFSFIHKCAKVFGIGKTDLLEGRSSNLSSYTVTRKGQGKIISKEEAIEIDHLAIKFRDKLAEPYLAKYEYEEELQSKPIKTTTHSGQEFDYVISGKLKVRVGNHTEILEEGDSIYYNSSTPHGMIAVGGEDCTFIAVVVSGEDSKKVVETTEVKSSAVASHELLVKKFIETEEDENGILTKLDYKNEDEFNFAFDVVDAIADKYPDKLAMLHISNNKTERRFTFNDMKKESARAANYFASLGIKKGDRVMLVLKRHYQFWISALALHKLGAVIIPATNQLVVHDFEYRFEAAGVSAIVCTGDGETAAQVDTAAENYGGLAVKVIVGKDREGWHNFDTEYKRFRSIFARTEDTACGNDSMLMFFTSGTTGYPKIAEHSYKYALGHFITAKYWHSITPDDLHFTISDTGWGKAMWGKFYGQWMCEGAIFTYDFDRFDA